MLRRDFLKRMAFAAVASGVLGMIPLPRIEYEPDPLAWLTDHPNYPALLDMARELGAYRNTSAEEAIAAMRGALARS